jgi:two-component system, chemotaxis family, sensor kinase CheA
LNRKDLILDFVSEARDQIDSAENCLLTMEEAKKNSQPIPEDSIHTLFRNFHTLKGSSGLLGLQSIVTVTHEAETILDLIRNHSNLDIIIGYTENLFKTIDFLRILFQDIERTQSDPSDNERVPLIQAKLSSLVKKLKSEISGEENLESKENEPVSRNFGLFEESETTESQERIISTDRFGLFDEDTIGNSDGDTKNETITSQTQETPSPEPGEPSQNRRKEIKISTDKLDLLLDLVGELVIAESNVTHHPDIENLKLEKFRAATRHLNKIVRDLQEVALSTRMIPVAGIFNRMNRLIRDLERKTKKEINLVISGEDTEIDKSVVDMVSDPIIHILRNAIDHGIESPETRRESGKKPEGTIKLHALQSSNEVWIIILDDGAGLNRDKLVNKAYQKGILDNKDIVLSDREVHELIFHPGFSTASEVSDISGRGVGMDIVKKNIEKLGGKIEIFSQEGVGTKFILRIPLSLGIMEGTVLKAGDSYFTIQTIEIRELVKLSSTESLEIYKNQKVVEIRGNHIPMLSINDILNLRNPIEYNESDNQILIVLEKDGEVLGLLADSIIGNQSIVIKSLTDHLTDAKGVNGFTILGNGKVSLILDTKSIFENFRSSKTIHQKALV